MEIGFYHLTRSTLEQALPKLLAKVLSLPGRAVVLGGSVACLPTIDVALWQAEEWLPHNAPGGGDAALQPIWLTAEDGPAPNAARHLFLVRGADSAHLAGFDRAFDLFDGGDDGAVEAARSRFREARAAGHNLAYWQQGATGGWEKRA